MADWWPTGVGLASFRIRTLPGLSRFTPVKTGEPRLAKPRISEIGWMRPASGIRRQGFPPLRWHRRPLVVGLVSRRRLHSHPPDLYLPERVCPRRRKVRSHPPDAYLPEFASDEAVGAASVKAMLSTIHHLMSGAKIEIR